MNNGDSSHPPQGMPAFPFGMFPNQMMPQPFPNFLPNPAMGAPFNSTSAVPQMMPAMFNMMAGMHQQMLNPMQFPHPAINPMMPPGPSPNTLMPAGQPMMPMGMMPHPMGNFPYVFVPMHMPFWPPPMHEHVPIDQHVPIPVQIKNEPSDGEVQCTEITMKVSARTKNSFAMADILGKTEVKSEIPDEQDMTNSLCTSISTRASDSIDSHPPLGVPPLAESSLSPPFIPEDIPDTPASPDYYEPYADPNPCYSVPQSMPEDNAVTTYHTETPSVRYDGSSETRVMEGGDEYMEVESAQSPTPSTHNPIHSPIRSRWDDSPQEKSTLTSRSSTPDRLRIIDPNESVLSEGEELHLEESIEDPAASSAGGTVAEAKTKDTVDGAAENAVAAEAEVSKESPLEAEIDLLLAQIAADEKESNLAQKMKEEDTAPKKPRIPPRFPQSKRKREEKEGREREKKLSSSPPRRSPIERKQEGIASPSSPIEKKERRVAPCTILLKGVPDYIERPRIVRYFEERYNCICAATRMLGQPTSTVRIVFPRKELRDKALSDSPHDVSRKMLRVYEEVLPDEEDEEEEKKKSKEKGQLENVQREEKKADGDEDKKHSPIRIPSGGDSVKDYSPPHLSTYLGQCGMHFRHPKDLILTAGPIPSGCNMRRVVDYFRSLCVEVFHLPYPSNQSRHFLVLYFDGSSEARHVLAAEEHRVDGHIIPVSPPYDVHIRLNNMNGPGQIEALIGILQNSCGVVAKTPRIKTSRTNYMYGYISFARPHYAEAAIKYRSFAVYDGRCDVQESMTNFSFQPFKDVWEAKCMISKIEEERKKSTTRGSTRISTDHIKDHNLPIITVGPIPDHLEKECDDYLRKHFDAVHNLPYPNKYGKFRLLVVRDVNMTRLLFKDGYIRVGEKKEKILLSPSFDVAFTADRRHYNVPVDQLIKNMQSKYGPIARPVFSKPGVHRVTFGRIQDAQRAMFDSPHFKSLQVKAAEDNTNISFAPFVRIVDLKRFYERAEEAARNEQAAKIVVNCRTNSDGDNQSNDRRRKHSEEDEEVLLCSPVKKMRYEEEESKVVVRVTDEESWMPKREDIVKHFSMYGRIVRYTPGDHNEAIIEFRNRYEMMNALSVDRVNIGGIWLDILQYR